MTAASQSYPKPRLDSEAMALSLGAWLDRVTTVAESLARVLEGKTQALIKQDMEALHRADSQLEQLSQQQQQLEKQHQQWLATYGFESVSLSELMPSLAKHDAFSVSQLQLLQEKQAHCLQAFSRVGALRAQNEALLQFSMNYVSLLLKEVDAVINPTQQTYDPQSLRNQNRQKQYGTRQSLADQTPSAPSTLPPTTLGQLAQRPPNIPITPTNQVPIIPTTSETQADLWV